MISSFISPQKPSPKRPQSGEFARRSSSCHRAISLIPAKVARPQPQESSHHLPSIVAHHLIPSFEFFSQPNLEFKDEPISSARRAPHPRHHAVQGRKRRHHHLHRLRLLALHLVVTFSGLEDHRSTANVKVRAAGRCHHSQTTLRRPGNRLSTIHLVRVVGSVTISLVA